MRRAGDYIIRFVWQAFTEYTVSSSGDPTENYADPVNLWGGYETDRSGAIEQWLESDQASYAATIRIRNYPAVKPADYLTDPQTGEAWYVDTVRRGDNELLCEVSR